MNLRRLGFSVRCCCWQANPWHGPREADGRAGRRRGCCRPIGSSCLARDTKSAQMPFSKVLLGAMTHPPHLGPTPFEHMVKAGVFPSGCAFHQRWRGGVGMLVAFIGLP